LNLKISKKFTELFKQLKTGLTNRFYIYFGGRGSGKSWAIAIFIVLIMRLKKYRVLCTREYQKNIADSSKKLIEDTIKRFKLDHEFDMQRGVTRHKKTGSEILYYGLHHNAQEIKSLEGVDIVWCEESENTSQESLDLLIPTIRKPKSIIIFTLNPDKKENPVYKGFIDSPGYDSLIREKVNYCDNEHFPNVLQEEMERCRERDPEKYDWIWEGNCREFSDSQILKGCYTIKDFDLPNDLSYCFGADWGFSQDPNTLVKMYVDMSNNKLYITDAIHKTGVEINDTPGFYERIEGSRQYPITADSARPEIISYMRKQGFRIKPAKKGKNSIGDGIAFIRNFDVIIHPSCKGVIEEFKLYSYKMDRTTGAILPQILDDNNHYIDAIRYGLEDYRPGNRGSNKLTVRL